MRRLSPSLRPRRNLKKRPKSKKNQPRSKSKRLRTNNRLRKIRRLRMRPNRIVPRSKSIAILMSLPKSSRRPKGQSLLKKSGMRASSNLGIPSRLMDRRSTLRLRRQDLPQRSLRRAPRPYKLRRSTQSSRNNSIMPGRSQQTRLVKVVNLSS
jgi:hypothetical protein